MPHSDFTSEDLIYFSLIDEIAVVRFSRWDLGEGVDAPMRNGLLDFERTSTGNDGFRIKTVATVNLHLMTILQVRRFLRPLSFQRRSLLRFKKPPDKTFEISSLKA
jgi:hypothetical protein